MHTMFNAIGMVKTTAPLLSVLTRILLHELHEEARYGAVNSAAQYTGCVVIPQ